MNPTKILADERFAGKRAPFHVYYYHNGKGKVDAAYTETEEAAERFIRKNRTGKIEIAKIVATVGDF